jgi:hypothetical protein
MSPDGDPAGDRIPPEETQEHAPARSAQPRPQAMKTEKPQERKSQESKPQERKPQEKGTPMLSRDVPLIPVLVGRAVWAKREGVPAQTGPNIPVERTAHSAGVFPVRESVGCGPPLTGGVCAVHAVMLGGESPLSRCTWSRRTREAQGRSRKGASEGSVERTCGARNTNRIGGVVQPGRAGTQQQSPPSTSGLCFINPASMHGRYDSLPREAFQVPREVACHGNGLSGE